MSLQTKLCLNSSSGTGDEEPKELKLFGNNISKMIRDSENCVDSELWDACAGSRVKMPAINSIVYYFPHGHGEHAQFSHDNLQMMNPPHVLCRVVSLNLMADPETDEVFAKIHLVPIQQNPVSDRLIEEQINVTPDKVPEERPVCHAKTLTESDASESSFIVPRQCALTIFPRLINSNVQYICCTDVHGETWSFRHIYRGRPRRHLLTTGWSTFVNRKRLVNGDSIVFLKKEGGEIHVGIRRMKRGARIRNESVIEAMRLASGGQAFEVEYYPRAGTPEYCVKAALVRKATTIPWCPGMRIKMAVVSEDQWRISWFMGTITSVQNQWPKSLWRQLEVTWEKATGMPEDVKRVNPWLVESVSSMSMPAPLHLDAALSPPAKKPCLQFPPSYDYLSSICPLISTGHQFQVLLQQQLHCSSISGIQGSRHDDYKLHYSPIFHIGGPGYKLTTTAATSKHKSSFRFKDNDVGKDDVACALTIGVGRAAATSAPTFRLFGQTMVINAEGEEKSDASSSGNDKSSSNANHGSS